MTPVFSSTMQYLVLNPTWTVPPTILKEDLIPEVRKNSQALAKKNIKVYDRQGNPMNTDSIDWTNNKVFSYTYRQDAGKSNALGVVKFMFPNSYGVYLHDTPSKELFERTERAFSSGCIRVQKPLDLAVYLLSDQPDYPAKEINRIIGTGITQTIMLKHKPEVYLLYLTSWVDDFGRLNFRNDIYSRDKRLIDALNSEPVFDL
jgi:murein L,D-transpeptidase YcbB/YkuD